MFRRLNSGAAIAETAAISPRDMFGIAAASNALIAMLSTVAAPKAGAMVAMISSGARRV